MAVATVEGPRIWVYDLQHLHSGITFPELIKNIASPHTLIAKEEWKFGSYFNSPTLAFKGDLRHPTAIHVDGKNLAFTQPALDLLRMNHAQRKQMKESLPASLIGKDFLLWTMRIFPNPEDRFNYELEDRTSPMLDPAASENSMQEGVKAVYQSLLELYPVLAHPNGQRIALGWYPRGGDRYRIAIRPGEYEPGIYTTLL